MLVEVELMRVGVHQIRVGLSWMDSIVGFLKEHYPMIRER